MKYFFTLFLALACTAMYSQVSLTPADRVSTSKATGQTFQSVDLFTPLPPNGRTVGLTGDHELLELDESSLQRLVSEAPNSITLQLPGNARSNEELELVKVDFFAEGFAVYEAGIKKRVDYQHGIHYRGVLSGDGSSLAAVSFFENEVMGLVSSDRGNYVLGKVAGDNSGSEYVYYNDEEVFTDLGLGCDTEDDGVQYSMEEITYQRGRALSDVVDFYFEVDYDIYQDKGSTVAAANYVLGLANQVGILYDNDGITTGVSEIVVWTRASPYNSTSSGGMLAAFQNNLADFNGDLAQLLSYKASGGIAAGFEGICNNNRDESMSFSSINSTYLNVPTYSWSVMVVTHEFGHLFGSRHTHACVWNGNGTAIDGCSGQTEGSCPLPGFPSNGGTIMSYCHLQSVGINLNNGFGSQPRAVVQSRVDNGNCLDDAFPTPTCGSNNITVTINTDNYPGETTWEIRNDNDQVFASGGPYQSTGTTYTQQVTLGDGTYRFWIYDSYGDGICCQYGNGSYTVTDNQGTTLLSGGAFARSETSEICISGTPDGDAPSVPQNLVASNIDETSADLSWNASSDNVGVTGYRLYIDGSFNQQVSGTSVTLINLTPNTLYRAEVSAVDAAGNESARSSEASFTTLEVFVDTQDPTTPTNLAANNITETSADISWSASSDNVGVTGYEVFVDGGAVGTTTNTNASLTGLSASTTYSVRVEAFDAAGNRSTGDNSINVTTLDPPSCQPVVLNTTSFESGLDGWIDGGGDAARVNSTTRSADGSYSFRIRDNSGTASSLTSPSFDLSAYDEVQVTFTYYPNSMENGEDFWFRGNNGTGWQTLSTYVSGSTFTNNNFYTETITVTASGGFGTNVQFRFQCDASGNADRVYIDLITITGNCSSGSGLVTGEGLQASRGETLVRPGPVMESTATSMEPDAGIEGATLFPNPTRNEINLDFQVEQAGRYSFEIFDLNGKQIMQRIEQVTEGANRVTFDLDKVAPGIYLIRFGDDEQREVRRFLKKD